MNEKLLFEGNGWTLKLEEASLPDGRKKQTARAKLPNTAHILAFPRPRTILLLREYRPFYGRYLWMIPSGKIDKESDVRGGALRELREETGYTARSFREFGTFRHIETVDYVCNLFIAEDLVHDPLPQDADEVISVEEVAIDEALERVLSEPPCHTVTVLALLKYLHESGRT